MGWVRVYRLFREGSRPANIAFFMDVEPRRMNVGNHSPSDVESHPRGTDSFRPNKFT